PGRDRRVGGAPRSRDRAQRLTVAAARAGVVAARREADMYAPRAMGQLVSVTEKPSSLPGVVRFELNRVLTGMGHERFRSPAEATGPHPAAELARRLFATGKVAAVHVYSNIVTVDLAKGATSEGLADVVRH